MAGIGQVSAPAPGGPDDAASDDHVNDQGAAGDLQRQIEQGTSGRHRASLRARRTRDNIHGYLFMAPQLIGLLAFMIGPLIFALVLAFCDYDGFGPIKFVGVDNFKALTDTSTGVNYGKSAWNTIWFTALQVPVLMVSALVFAWILQNSGRIKNLYRACFFAPSVTAAVAVSVIWLLLFNPDISPLNSFLKHQLGMQNPPNWLQDARFTIPAVVIVSVWQGLGYQVVMFMAALDNVPASMMEAAAIDGASEWQKLLKITIPMISPTVLFLSITSIIGSFQVFDYIYVFYDTTAPDFGRTIVYEIYNTAFKEFRFGVGSALALLLFLSLLAITGLQLLAQRKWVYYTE